jgi:hypothetical protein
MAGWIKATYDNIDETVWLNLSHAYVMESTQRGQGIHTTIRFMNGETASVREHPDDLIQAYQQQQQQQ